MTQAAQAPQIRDVHTDFDFDREWAARSYKQFVIQAWHVIEPGVEFVDNWHIDYICESLAAVAQGKIRKLLITMPPRHCKSRLCSVFFAPWVWVRQPWKQFLYTSYRDKLSVRDSVHSRRLIESKWYQERWGDKYQLQTDQSQKHRFDNTMMGYRLATSVDGIGTGEGGNFVICDDPNSVREAESELKRTSTNEWWDQVMPTRLNDFNNDAFIVIQQRVHEDDLSGHILELYKGWDHLCLPAQFERNHPFPMKSSLGFKDPRTVEGELLWPARFSQETIADLKESLREKAAGQLQQRPAPMEGGMFKRKWFRTYKDEGDHLVLHFSGGERRIFVKDLFIFIVGDTAVSEKKSADFTNMDVYGVRDGLLILLDKFRDRVEGPESERHLLALRAKWSPSFILIEKSSVSATLVQRWRRLGLNIRDADPDRDKVSRAWTAAVMMDNERIFFPQSALWIPDLYAELLVFPNGRNDDQCDTLAYAARWVDEHMAGKSMETIVIDSMPE